MQITIPSACRCGHQRLAGLQQKGDAMRGGGRDCDCGSEGHRVRHGRILVARGEQAWSLRHPRHLVAVFLEAGHVGVHQQAPLVAWQDQNNKHGGELRRIERARWRGGNCGIEQKDGKTAGEEKTGTGGGRSGGQGG